MAPVSILTTIVVILAASLNACSSAPTRQADRCDMQQPAGACNVRVDFTKGQVTVCSVERAQVAPVCMNSTLDITTSKGYLSRKILLMPGECRTLGTDVTSAAQSSCTAYAMQPEAVSAASN